MAGRPPNRYQRRGCNMHCVIWVPGGDGIILRVCAHCPAQLGKHYEEDAERKQKMVDGSRRGHAITCGRPIS